MPKRKAQVQNLNSLLGRQRKAATVVQDTGEIQLYFDSSKILKVLEEKIKKATYVVGCVAWLTNKKILGALRKTRGVQIIVTNDSILRRMKPYYSNLPVYNNASICVVGSGRGKMKSLMHHKFLIGLNEMHQPIWTCNGSFNITESAKTNLENITFYSNESIGNAFLSEFKGVYKISKKLKLS